ncbi:MAG: transcription factor [Desulfurococcales archaeon]|nr:transcription factor [Desulfurococcales archaeon]
MASNDAEVLEGFVRAIASMSNIDAEHAAIVLRQLLSEKNGKGLSDEDLETLTNIKQGEIRRILRLLYELRLASYRRGKHPETGATRYYWRLNVHTINNVLLSRKKAVLRNLELKLQYEESNVFYYCPLDGTRYTFEEAYEYNFQCPKCGSILEEDSRDDIKKALRVIIERLRESIKRDEMSIGR